MDRCRCEEYEAAVKKIKFYTVGTYRPDLIENYDSKYRQNIRLQDAAAYIDVADEEETELFIMNKGEQIAFID